MGRRITVIGGDFRQCVMAEHFIKDGFDLSLYGFNSLALPPTLKLSETLTDALSGSKLIILGISPCDEKMNISTPLWDDTLSADTLISHLTSDCIIVAGKPSDAFISLCSNKGIRCIDYVNREEFAILNAVPTVEGALEIAMRELPFTINSSNCLVTGFGRIGKLLGKALDSLGARVTCSARKCADLAWIKTCGFSSVHTAELSDKIHDFNIIFNTIPALIFNRDLLRNIRPDTLIIDLASKPGGVDIKCAEELGIKVIWALSLPGKTAPVTAGKIIKDTLNNIIKEM